MTPDSVIAAIRAELHRRGSNAYRAARDAGLPENSLRYLLAGHEPKVGRLIEICDALGLQFYVGPAGEGLLDAPGFDPAAVSLGWLKQLESSARTLNRVVIEAGGDPFPPNVGPGLDAVDQDEPVSTDGRATRAVTVVELASAAGDGADPVDETRVGVMWFGSDWLDQHGLDAAQCAVIGVRGESMEPTLPDGCSILVDRASRDRRTGNIYVLRTSDGLVVKRLAREGGKWWLVSEHPDWEKLSWPVDAEIVGRVRWMAGVL